MHEVPPLKSVCIALFCAGLLTGCASKPVPVYQGLAAAPELTPDRTGDRHVAYRYDALDVNWRGYHSALIEPVAIYSGADNQFGDMAEADRAALAGYMQSAFAEALNARFAPATVPGPGVLQVHVTLTGAQASVPILSPATKLMPVGAAINLVKTIEDKPAKYTGSVTFAVEIRDGATGRLLKAYVSKEYPLAEDIRSSVGPLGAAEAGIRRGADALVKALQ